MNRLYFAGLMVMLAGLAVVGCDAAVKPTVAQTKKDHDHSGWWCDEHGIPEAECSMCSQSVAKDCKGKGDWCDKHDRAMSQCFTCKPERKEFYAAQYRERFGKEPPPIEE